MLGTFTITRPSALADALEQINEDSVAYWGGTELFLAMKMQLLLPQNLVDLKAVEQLRGIRVEGGALVLGAGTSHAAAATDELVCTHAPLLARTAAGVGNARVRAQGTLGGNLCFGEPRSDIATVLLALGGTVVLASTAGRRELTIPDFVLGPYWTAREPEELLVELRVPLPAAAGVYRKFSLTERPTIAVAVARAAGPRPCRIAIGAVSDVPVLHEFETWDAVDPEAVAAELEPVGDLAGSVTYKRHTTAVLVRRAVADVVAAEAD